ncbi:MAG: DeoR/GlpR family DNA-binding transcription regulator [Spirochaetaceae bacterium]|nr:DeoR/GlpR family DNA-binding transcription regulator [Spirochaetaceae bacterium]
MSHIRVEEIKDLLLQNKKVYVRDLSERYGVSEVSVRKYLSRIEAEGFAERFYGGASLIEAPMTDDGLGEVYSDPLWLSLARQARSHITDGDTVFIGSGRSCCVLARELAGINNLTVVTNNITALPELIKNSSRVYLIGGEVTTTDSQTLFSSWESPQSQLGNIFVNKAFTSISGLDLKAGLTVDSIISTYIYKQIPSMAHRWYLIADSRKFGKISIYPVADISQIHTLITDQLPEHYAKSLAEQNVEVIRCLS